MFLIYKEKEECGVPKRRRKISKRILLIIALIFSIGICAYLSVNLHFILSKDFEGLLNIDIQTIINTLITEKEYC